MRMMASQLPPRRGGQRTTALVAAVAALVVATAPHARGQGSAVQGVPNAMQGFSQNRDKPIQIDAGSLEVRDKEKAATFKDNVKVVQGDTTLRCKTLIVYYEGGATPGAAPTPAPKSAMTSATPGPTGSSSIRRLEAKGGVIVTQKEQTVTGDNGVFDMKANIVTMQGNVVLTKGDNVLKGDRLIVDMTTGVSRVESNSGHVQGLFKSSGQDKGAAGTQGPPSLFPSAPTGSTSPAKPPSNAPGNR
jgi:lipopolysaccharide export system protein LptA